MDPIKEAFARAKQDILELKEQLTALAVEINEIKRTLNQQINRQTDQQTDSQITAVQNVNTTDSLIPTDRQTDNLPLEAVKTPILTISNGNRGVPTDRQTDQQTDRQTEFLHKISLGNFKEDTITHLEKVSEVLDSLDSIKKELRAKFKKLTPQEMLVFSALYQLEEQGFIVDYPLLASKLSLSESSIRDYTQKLLKKGIPISKSKQDNKANLS